MNNLIRVVSLALALPLVACALDPGSDDTSTGTASDRELGVGFDPATGLATADSAIHADELVSPTMQLQPGQSVAATGDIVGADGRVRVSPTTSFPARARVRIVVDFSDGYEATASGHMVGDKYVITAGHVVYSADHGGWATKLYAFPGEDGSAKPYSAMMVYMRTTQGWVDSQDDDVDYALVTLDQNVGNQTGWFGLATFSDDFFDNNPTITLAGYPGEKPFGTQWAESGPIVDNSSNCLFYNVDSTPGDSGAGIAIIYNGNHYVTGVHHGSGYDWLSYYNQATRITNARFTQIQGWIASGI